MKILDKLKEIVSKDINKFYVSYTKMIAGYNSIYKLIKRCKEKTGVTWKINKPAEECEEEK